MRRIISPARVSLVGVIEDPPLSPDTRSSSEKAAQKSCSFSSARRRRSGLVKSRPSRNGLAILTYRAR
jgi:hypothetical protein